MSERFPEVCVATRSLPLAVLAVLGIGLTVVGCSPKQESQQETASARQLRKVGDADLANESNTAEWLGYSRTYSEQRFSPLTDINASTIARLGVDWSLDLPQDAGLVGTPLVADGVLYFTNSLNMIRAVDATSGKLMWEYNPRSDGKPVEERKNTAYIHGGRGVALWGEKVYVGAADGRLIAVDRSTGKEVWTVQTFDPKENRYLTGAPKALKGMILIGNGGSETGRYRGYVTAYDAETGKLAWRFYVVPGNPADGFENKAMEMAAKTWTGEWWKNGGGGQNWGEGYTYDAEFNTIYIGTGNGTPWNRSLRSPGGGDNLFLSSIVAVDADTGEYKWHYQQVPGEQWDWDATSPMVLADLTIKGQPVKALMQAPKNGLFYVIDRATGKLVSADPYTEVNWATKVDLSTGRPVVAAIAEYAEGKDAKLTPGDWGAHSWQPISYSPKAGLVYIPVFHEYNIFTTQGQDLDAWRHPEKLGRAPFGSGVQAVPAGSPRKDGLTGTLTAWDPVNQKIAWEAPHSSSWSPGVLSTAGDLVFQGNTDGKLYAYDAKTGKVLWNYDLGLGIAGSPITYQINGRQYLAILVGWGGGWAAVRGGETLGYGWQYGRQMRRLVAFALDGKVELVPQPPPQPPQPLKDDSFKADKALAAKGAELYGGCTMCHGAAAASGGGAPDLRASGIVLSADAFKQVLHDGVRYMRGMPPFPHMSDDDLLALRHYIRSRAEEALAAK